MVHRVDEQYGIGSPGNAYPQVAGDTATITTGMTINVPNAIVGSVHLNGVELLGNGNSLTLDSNGAGASYTLNSWEGYVSVPMILNDNATLNLNATDRQVHFSSTISDGANGPKALTIGFGGDPRNGIMWNSASTNTYSGGTTLTDGMLRVQGGTQLGLNVSGNTIAVNANAGTQTNLLLDNATARGASQAITLNSLGNSPAGLALGFDPVAAYGSLANLNVTATNGGVYSIYYNGTGGVTSLATLDSTFGCTGGNHMYFGSASYTGGGRPVGTSPRRCQLHRHVAGAGQRQHLANRRRRIRICR